MPEESPAQFKSPGALVLPTEQKKAPQIKVQHTENAPTPQSIELAGGIEEYMRKLQEKKLPPEEMSEKVVQIFQLLTQLNEKEQVQFGAVIERMMQLPDQAKQTPVLPGTKVPEPLKMHPTTTPLPSKPFDH